MSLGVCLSIWTRKMNGLECVLLAFVNAEQGLRKTCVSALQKDAIDAAGKRDL